MTATTPRIPGRTAPSDEAVEAIRATILDYFEGWYDADGARMARALHPDLVKRSRTDERPPGEVSPAVTAAQMITWAAAGEGRDDAIGGDRTVEIEIFDVSGDLASALAMTPLYHEYLQLVTTPAGWRIVTALWRYQDGQPHQP